MTSPRSAVLRLGDWVRFDDEDHQVVGLAGTSVRLRSAAGAEMVVLASYLLASPSFEVIDSGQGLSPALEPFGLLDGLPEEVLATAREWQRHVVEVETGLAPQPAPGATPRPEYDPAARTLAQRDAAKAAELGVGARTVERMRARYAQQGLWGLVSRRDVAALAGVGRADARLVAAAREVIAAETDASTGTRSRLIRRVIKQVEATHGPGVVPLPGKTTFYRLIDTLSAGRHTFGSAVTRRQTANRPAGVFTPSFAARPGEQVQIDSTPIDVLVLLDDGLAVRADLTIAVDVATRTIGAAVLRPVDQGGRRRAAAGPDAGPGTDAPGLGAGAADVGIPAPARPAARHRHPHARRGGPPGDRPGHHRDRPREGVRLRHLQPGLRAAGHLGAALPAGMPTDKGIVESTLGSINTLFCQHVAGYTGPNVTRRGADPGAAWTIAELQDLLDEWLIGLLYRPLAPELCL